MSDDFLEEDDDGVSRVKVLESVKCTHFKTWENS